MCDQGNTEKLQSDWTHLIQGAGTIQCIELAQTLSHSVYKRLAACVLCVSIIISSSLCFVCPGDQCYSCVQCVLSSVCFVCSLSSGPLCPMYFMHASALGVCVPCCVCALFSVFITYCPGAVPCI